jgi:hypothetical protein
LWLFFLKWVVLHIFVVENNADFAGADGITLPPSV